jgi:3-keto-L-gulonate-6-phosphate decarboxylase
VSLVRFSCAAQSLEAEIKAGADLVTVMGAVDDETIKGAGRSKKQWR